MGSRCCDSGSSLGPDRETPARPWVTAEPSLSEVRRLCFGHGIFREPEDILVVFIVLGAYRFHHWPAHLAPAHRTRPRRVERAGIVHRHARLDGVSAIGELPMFHHVEVLGVRRAPIVHETI